MWQSTRRVISYNFNMKLYDYYCKLRYKTFYFYACYHTLTAYLSFHAILTYNLKMHYFRDNYAFLKNIFQSRLFSSILDIIIGF